MGDEPVHTDVVCSFCGVHNRVAHMVGGGDDLRICSVCLAKAASVMDAEAGATGDPVDWLGRWSLKDGSLPT